MDQKVHKGKVTVAGGDVRKADTKALIINGADAFPEDSFVGSYWAGGQSTGVAIIQPQFTPTTLKAVCAQNNTLLQCIEAMEVNIDATGHSIDLIEGEEEEDEAEKKMLEDFFNEPFPGKNMEEIRREYRRDLEQSGIGYFEVLRNLEDDIVALNHVPNDDMRLIRLDDAVPVEREVSRAGKPMTLKIMARERRFVQNINGKKIYFKEFGSKRGLNKDTGMWEENLPPDKRASEIIYEIGNKEPKTPYGSPRWINQLPSALGSRKAEEFNLEYFDAGGLPPVLVIVQGGTLGDQATGDLKRHLNGKGNKHRAAVVEAVSTSGSLDSAGAVQVKVERFGSERQSDAMFQTYDKNCEEHIRVAFRLPPLFLGKAADFNFATAYTAYMVAEAQVFFPEREQFDNLINTKIVRALGAKKYRFRSLPLTLLDVKNQMEALKLASDKNFVDGEQVVKTLNELVGMALEYKEPDVPPPPPVGKIDPLTGLPYTQPVPPQHPADGVQLTATGTEPKPKNPADKARPVVKMDSALVELAALFAEVGMDELCNCASHME